METCHDETVVDDNDTYESFVVNNVNYDE